LGFLLAFALLMGSYEAARGTPFEQFLLERVILRPTVGLINFFTPEEHVEQHGRVIRPPGGSGLRVTRGCEGVEMLLLLAAAVIAFPATAAGRARGLLWGSLLAYLLSIARLTTLYYVLRYSPLLWQALHGLILPLGPIMAIAAYFVRWTATAPLARTSHAT
jgi:exosortase family protein XrtM